MPLLTDCALVGIPSAGNKLATWKADGTLIGTITLPANTPNKTGSVAASITDSRIYVVVETTPVSSNHLVLVYNDSGVLQATITPGRPVRALYVPEAGKLWVATNEVANGAVKEYNTSGVLQSTIANLTYTGGGYIEAGYGMFRYSGFLYYLALRGVGFEANSGVFKDNLSDAAVSVLVRELQPNVVDTQLRRMAMASTGDIYVLDHDPNRIFRTVDKFNSAGVFQRTIHFGGALAGIALDQNDSGLWVGDTLNALIYRNSLSPESSTFTSFSATAGGLNCSSVLTTPLGTSAPVLAATCPVTTTGTLGKTYAGQVNAVGGNPPYTYGITAGALPPGLTLNANTGVISGTPTIVGTFNFTITVTDTP